MVGATAASSCAPRNTVRPTRSTWAAPTRSVHRPATTVASVRVAVAAALAAPYHPSPSRASAIVGRIESTARFSNAPRTTRPRIPAVSRRWAWSQGEADVDPAAGAGGARGMRLSLWAQAHLRSTPLRQIAAG
jgi:hypothetical protein